MKALAKSWENMKSIPARSGIEDEFEGDRKEDDLCVKVDMGEGVEAVKFGSPDELFSEFWPLLLWAVSSSDEIEDGLLYRWIKDASGYGASFSKSNKFFKLVAGETVAKDKTGEAATEAAESVTLRAQKGGMDMRGGLNRFLKLNDNTSENDDMLALIMECGFFIGPRLLWYMGVKH
ncbi:expressed unknown protein [Ectocarpus siliculosus]|uniref:Uncharacterized protein n=1 Tax=Ectocarpus siliculosus TaxID=2880 RepID=D7FP32_ECTSI|nr:expressed unknown protein [Ectocarpus siliculosus]|eukprot:CBJ30296.1 expressed unknown protein [Ectocarpus siliculosus]